MFYWDPKPEIFVLPYLNFPILWYGALFALGFFVGFFLFVSILQKYFLNEPEYMESDILCPTKMTKWGKSRKAIAKALNAEIQKEGAVKLPLKEERFVKKANPKNPKKARVRLFLDQNLEPLSLGVFKKATQISDRFLIYILIGTVVGARLGHIFFYERPEDYLHEIVHSFRVWEGIQGLASHGAAISLFLAIYIFSHRVKNIAKELTWIRLADFVSIPVALCGVFIRIGNFFNQEILGTPTNLPWGVVFGHSSGGPSGVPLHPVQLYEACFYLFTFLFLWHISKSWKVCLSEGRLIGLFLIFIFGSRFFVEFVKYEQSQVLSASLNMGQLLSIPLFTFGIYLFVRSLVNGTR